MNAGLQLERGQKYWTIWPVTTDWTAYDHTETILREFSDEELIREWVCGVEPVFDEWAMKRVKIYTSRDDCIKDARAKLAEYEVDE